MTSARTLEQWDKAAPVPTHTLPTGDVPKETLDLAEAGWSTLAFLPPGRCRSPLRPPVPRGPERVAAAIAEPAPGVEDPTPLRAVHTANFPALLRQLEA